MRYLISLLILFMGTAAEAQSFRLIPYGRETNFLNEDGDRFYVRQDSFEVIGADTILYLNYRIGPADGLAASCLNAVEDSIPLGRRVLIKEDSTWVFFNRYNDSIFLKPKNEFTEDWRIYTYPDGSYLEASGWFFNRQDILPSYQDTMKRWKIFAYTPIGLPDIINPFNDTVISWGGRSGLHWTMNWHDFPDVFELWQKEGVKTPDTTDVSAGQSANINARDIFNYREGNELHYRFTSKELDGFGDSLTQVEYVKLFALQRSDSPGADSVSLTWSRNMLRQNYDATGLVSESLISDTIIESIALANFSILDVFPGEYENWTYETAISTYDLHGYTSQMNDSASFFNRRQKQVFANFDFNSAEPCLESGTFTDFNFEATYLDGLGPFYRQEFYVLAGIDLTETYELLYYQKGLEEWGNPLDFDTIFSGLTDASVPHLDVSIFPNPVTSGGELSLMLMGSQASTNWAGVATFELIDLSGRLVERGTINLTGSPQLKLKVVSGAYFLRLQSGKATSIQKLIVK